MTQDVLELRCGGGLEGRGGEFDPDGKGTLSSLLSRHCCAARPSSSRSICLQAKESIFGSALPLVYLDCTSGVAAALVQSKTSSIAAQQRTARTVTETLLRDVQDLLPIEQARKNQPVLSHVTLAYAGLVTHHAHRMLSDSHTCRCGGKGWLLALMLGAAVAGCVQKHAQGPSSGAGGRGGCWH